MAIGFIQIGRRLTPFVAEIDSSILTSLAVHKACAATDAALAG